MIDAILKAEEAMERAAGSMVGWFKYPGTTWSGILILGFILESVGGATFNSALAFLGAAVVLVCLLPCLELSFRRTI